MNANEILDELKYVTKVLNMNTDVDTKPLVEAATMLRQQQAEIEKLRSWVEMLVVVPFFNEIDHYQGIPVAILRKASET